MAGKLVDKGPKEVLDYVVDFSSWIEAGDTIQAVGTTVVQDGVSEPSGLSDISVDSVVVGANLVIAWISGGTAGETYIMQWCAVDDNNPVRTVARHFKLKVKKK